MKSYFHRQYGGTMLGLVIGLVAGLAIAVVVALLITKSTPFNSKNDKAEKQATSGSVQSADPNLPLYRNRDAAKDASKEFVKDADIAKVTENAAASAPAKSENKPEGQHANEKSVKEDTPASSHATASKKPDGKESYYLQAGAFKSSTDAENMRARLALLGFEAGISEMISQNGTLYRVRIGPFAQAESMNRLRGKLKDNGVSADVIHVPK